MVYRPAGPDPEATETLGEATEAANGRSSETGPQRCALPGRVAMAKSGLTDTAELVLVGVRAVQEETAPGTESAAIQIPN